MFKEVGSGHGVELRHIRVESRKLEAAVPTVDVPRGTLRKRFTWNNARGPKVQDLRNYSRSSQRVGVPDSSRAY
jgi:hypothetical protein